MAQGNRMQRLSALIQNTLAQIIHQEMEDIHSNMVTITSVGLAKDLSNAKVFVSVWDDSKAAKVVEELNENSKFLRSELAHAVKLRVTPDLKFVYDDSIVRGHHVSSLIHEAFKKNKIKNDDK